MRVYEFARKQQLTSKDVLVMLKKAGFSSLTHMSMLTDDALNSLHSILLKKTKSPSAPKTKTEKSAATLPDKPAKETPLSLATKKPVFVKKTPHISKDKPVEEIQPTVSVLQKSKTNQISEIIVTDQMPLFQVADLMNKGTGEIILALMNKGMMCNRNQLLSIDIISSIASDFGITVVIPEKKPAREPAIKREEANGVLRWPVVVVMGHVDHGKTTLLDFIRKANVAAREKGGITQHIGAYEVDSQHGKIIFLDTPGHAAFTHMRRRGVRITDIVILVIAADDGIMPQTIEAIECAKAASVPIIVAINKIDKISSPAAIETVKRQLAEHDLLPEDWGGKTICIPISAKTGKGVEELLEMIVLQAQLMELKARTSGPVKAYVLESKMEKGYGPVATVIPIEGTLKQGDYFVCGRTTGKVRLLFNSIGEKLSQVEPSVPVRIIGFDALTSSGNLLQTISYTTYLKHRSGKKIRPVQQAVFSEMEQKDTKTINLIIKADTFGSNEAVLSSIRKIAKKVKEVKATFKIVHSGVGDIIERDVTLALDTGSLIVGLHVKAERNAVRLAGKYDVSIKRYNVIYTLLDDLEDILTQQKEPVVIEKKIGEALVLKVFDIKGVGIIAGCSVTNGTFVRNAKVACFREGKKIGEGKITSLERNRKTVKEVHSGSEFGFISSKFSDWQVDDIVHCLVQKLEKKAAA